MTQKLTGPALVAYLRQFPSSDDREWAAEEIERLRAERDALRKLLSSAAGLLDDASKALDETEGACFTIIHETESMAEHIRAALAQGEV